MSAKQGRLFDEPNARASGPETSKEAGRKVKRSGRAARQREMVLAILKRMPGSTYAELANAQSYEIWSRKEVSEVFERLKPTFHRRLPELRGRNLARVGDKRTCNINGTTMQTWFATEEAQ